MTACFRREDGSIVTDKHEVRTMFLNYFMDLFEKDYDCIADLCLKSGFPSLSQKVRDDLRRDFTAEDIKGVIMDMAQLKVPGPDGMRDSFYQNMWPIIENFVTDIALSFFRTCDIPEGFNDTIITLISKVHNLERPNQFRPISLCNVSYKIITKAMTNRRKEVMKEVVGPNQSSFVPERQIIDNIIIYQVIINTTRRKKGGKGLMVFKIDLEKAYDRLSWNFIKETMEKVGLEAEWTRNIMVCVETSRLSILWAGEHSDYFVLGTGIRQGDSRSPYLFFICIERLNHMIDKEVREERWRGIRASRKGPILSHLFFANDMIIFFEADMERVDVVLGCLNWFYNCSGQKVSLAKSQLFVSNIVSSLIAGQIVTKTGIPLVIDLGR